MRKLQSSWCSSICLKHTCLLFTSLHNLKPPTLPAPSKRKEVQKSENEQSTAQTSHKFLHLSTSTFSEMAGDKTYVESAQDALKSATDTVGSYAQSAKESIIGGVRPPFCYSCSSSSTLPLEEFDVDGQGLLRPSFLLLCRAKTQLKPQRRMLARLATRLEAPTRVQRTRPPIMPQQLRTRLAVPHSPPRRLSEVLATRPARQHSPPSRAQAQRYARLPVHFCSTSGIVRANQSACPTFTSVAAAGPASPAILLQDFIL